MAKKLISVILSLILAFSLSVNVFAASTIGDNFKELANEIKTNIDTTKESIGSIADLSGKLVEKMTPVILDFALDSENWEKAGKVMMDIIVKAFDKIIPDEPGTDPDEPGTDPDEPGTDPDEPGTDPDEPGTDPDEPGTDPDEPGTDPDEPGADPDEPEVPEVPGILDAIKDLTIEDYIKLIQTYFFINLEDIPDASTDIIESAEYTYVLCEDGRETIFIAVNIEEHPELLNRDLLMEATEKLYEEQKRLYPNISDDDIMSYEHIAGELALHAVLYALSNEYLKLSGATEGTIFNLWQRARIADLNITEERIPSEIIMIFGTYIMGVFIVDLYTIFKIFRD